MKIYFGGIAVSTLVGVASLAYGQDIIHIPAATYLRDAGFAGNQIFTSTSTSSHIMGSLIRMLSAPPGPTTITSFTGPIIRIRNSAFPDRHLDVGASTPAGSAGNRFGSGSLINSRITAGSTYTIECFASGNQDPSVSHNVSAFTISTTPGQAVLELPDAEFEVTLPGTYLFDSQLIAGDSAQKPFVMGDQVVIRGGVVDAKQYASPKLIIGHTAFPEDAMEISLRGDRVGRYEVPFNVVSRAKGSLIGKVIPASGHFTYRFKSSDPTSSFTDLSVGLVAGSPVQIYSTNQTLLCAGPMGNVNNGRASLGFVTSGFAGGHRLWIGGVTERVGTASTSPNIASAVFRNSAFPTWIVQGFGDGDPYPATSPFRVLRQIDFDFDVPPTFGLNFPTGSEFTVEAFASQSQANGHHQFLGMEMHITTDPNKGYLYEPVEDLGVLSANAPIDVTVQGMRTSTPRWYKFSVPVGIHTSNGSWLDVWTEGTVNTNTQLSLFRVSGELLVTDDDDGNGNFSALSFGSGSGISPVTGAVVSNGRDGLSLPPGDYYLAVSRWLSTIRTGFHVRSSGLQILDSFQLRLRTNRAFDQVLTSEITGQSTLFNLGRSRTIEYSVVQGGEEVANGENVLYWRSTPASFRAPVGVTGPADLLLDGGSFLRRRVPLVLTGNNQSLPNILLIPGDVDNSGEIDATDIDMVIASFGQTNDSNVDVDISGEVDAADIDLVIGNLGLTDE